MSSVWNARLQEAGTSQTTVNVTQIGNGRAVGVPYPASENVRYMHRQGTAAVQGVQRPIGNMNARYSFDDRLQAYNTTPIMEGRLQYPSSCTPRGRFTTRVIQQKGHMLQRNSMAAHEGPVYLSSAYNTPSYGFLPSHYKRSQFSQHSNSPSEELYQGGELFPECVAKLGNHDVLHLKPVAVAAVKNGFQPSGRILISQAEITFAVKREPQDKDVKDIRAVIHEMHVVKIAYSPGKETKKFLAFVLSDAGRSILPSELQVNEYSRYWDFIFYVRFPTCVEKGILSRLTDFYGSRVHYVAPSHWKSMHDLSRNIVRVMRYARFLEWLGKQNEECAKGDFVSQCASIEEHISSSFTAREANACCDSRQSGNGDVVAERVPYATQGVSCSTRGEQAIEDKNNNTSTGGTPSSCKITTQERLSSSWDTLSCTETLREPASVNADGCQFGQEEKLPVIKENCALSVKEYGAVAVSPHNYRSAGEFVATFRGFDDMSDFPTNFLEEESKPDVPSIDANKIQGEPLVLEDDGNASSTEDLKFKDGVSVTVSGARDNLLDGALMNGDVASFYIVHYIPHAMLPGDWAKRSKVYFANSDVYPIIDRKCRNKLIQGSGGEITAEMVREVFLSRKGAVPPYLLKLVETELSVIPIFWENHWLLGLIQMYAPEKEMVSGRLVIMDSKFDDARNANVLRKIADAVHKCFRLAIKAGLILSRNRLELKDFSLVRCEALPCQENGVDCGWFMALYAERFVKDMSWMDMTDDDVRRLRFSADETNTFRERIRNIRKEVGTYMERYSGRCLNFDYERRAITSLKSSHMPYLSKT